MADWTVFRTYLTPAEAELERAILEANGIPARVRADDAGGMLPSMQLLQQAALLVRAEDLEQAAAFLGEEDVL